MEEKEVNNDLEKEIVHYVGYPKEASEDVSTIIIRKTARYFAQWQKEQVLQKLEEWLEEYVSDLASVGTDTLIGSFKRYLNGEI